MKFKSRLYKLNEETIIRMSSQDNGSISNVLKGISDHCYGITTDDNSIEKINFFYINKSIKNPGYIFKLHLGEKKFYINLFNFSIFLTDIYQQLDPITTYETYIHYHRTLLEKHDIFTITYRELEKFESPNMTLLSKSRTEFIMNFDRVELLKFILKTPKLFRFKENTNYTYLMFNKDTNAFKIGRSTRPQYRERTLQSKEPHIELLKTWESEKRIEKRLHRHFRNKKLRGEWFKLSLTDIKHINKLVKELIKSTVANIIGFKAQLSPKKRARD
ncbi:MAG: GIY-YIG nuclease family protein [Chlorobi bacterium]|nr:GIY-YIG nuclease family protein [Chlorobiota bacterium]